MSSQSKKEFLQAIWGRYRRAGKRHKTKILDEFCAVCGYHRKHAIRLLRQDRPRRRRRRGPKPRYGHEETLVLQRIWLTSDQLCSKRLKAALPLWLPHYERSYGTLYPPTRHNLLSLSASTIDRLLRPVRARLRRARRSGTQPGTLLKNQIPIRTDHADATGPGYLEADTVAHCGNSLAGDFAWSVTFTDIFSEWTEPRAVWNKGATDVLAQVQQVESQLPFPLLGFDCDNGSEFLNFHLMRYLVVRPHPIGFTRSRPYHKNDNAHVEQKNWTHVRQLLGYGRFDNPAVVPLLNTLYVPWSRLHNFFCPSVKLMEKKRVGARTYKQYDAPQTPYQRLLACPQVSAEAKAKLEAQFASLDPFELKKEIEQKLKAVFATARCTQS